MRFNNKLIKLYIRYAKESGQYGKFKCCLERCVKKHTTSIDEFFNMLNHDLHFMTTIGFHDESYYTDCGEKYVFNLYRDEITQEFYSFIHENKIESFFDKIDYRFISTLDTKPISDKCNTKADFLFEHFAPSSFIVAPFSWSNTDEGFSFWNGIHKKWVIRFRFLLHDLIG